MPVVLGAHEYGKAENRVVRVFRDREPHRIVDYNVSVALSGGQEATYLAGDNASVLPTDTMKNTVFALALEDAAVAEPETFGLRLARHFVDEVGPITGARVELASYPWTGLAPHALVREGRHVRTAVVTRDATGTRVVSGVEELALLKTTDSEFTGFLRDAFTTLEPTRDRVLATSLKARWLHAEDPGDWGASHESVLATLMDTFAGHHSLALQQTVHAMGEAVVEAHPTIVAVRFTCPNLHHFGYDTARFGRENRGEVFHADDRPYGLMRATVLRAGAADPGPVLDG